MQKNLSDEEMAAIRDMFNTEPIGEVSEIRPSRWRAFWETHDRDVFFLSFGFVAGVVFVLVALDVWLFF